MVTGKRISQKLLRNCVKFLSIIHDVLNIPHLDFLKQTMDEVELRGQESKYDSRKLNSYPSKVCIQPLHFEIYFRDSSLPVSTFQKYIFHVILNTFG